MKKILIIFVFGLSILDALEFGYMGNTPASVGGAGVAYRKNSWALYYNPALLGVNRKSNIAYSFGAGYSENNLLGLASIDFNEIKISSNILGKLINTNSIKMNSANIASVAPIAAAGANDYSNLGFMTDILKNVSFNNSSNGITNENSFKSYIDSIIGQNGTDLSDSITKLKGLSGESKNTKFMQIKNDLTLATQKVSEEGKDVGIMNSILTNIDANKIDILVDSIKTSGVNGNFDISALLSAIGGITINYGANSYVDRLIDSYLIINNSVSNSNFKLVSNNGFVFHIGGNKNRGAIAFGVLSSIYGIMKFKMDKNFNRLIVNNGSNYYELIVNNNYVSLQSSDKNNYDSSSILSKNAKHNLYANNLSLFEVPIAYGHTIPLAIGNLHFGTSIKYIYAMSFSINQNLSLDDLSFKFDQKDNMATTNTFGIDLGALYTVSGFSLGLVGKNLNYPKIIISDGKFTIEPQVRAGFGFDIWRFTFLADIDILPNATLDKDIKNQMVGGGIIFDVNWIDFRFGAMRDLRTSLYGTILTGGINIFHFLDVAVQSNTIITNVNKYKIPSYFNIKVGGRFLF